MEQQASSSSQPFVNHTSDTTSGPGTGLEKFEPARYHLDPKPISPLFPHPAPALQSHHLTILLLSLLLIILSAPIIALGTFVGFKTIAVGSNGCLGCWRISAPDWDAGVAFYGSVLGAIGATLLQRIVTSVAQRRLITQNGATLRMFRRLAILDIFHLAQSRSLSFVLQRSWALPILLATYLASSSTIALIGTHTVPGVARNPLGSAGLDLLNATLFYSTPDGALFGDIITNIDPSNFDGPVVRAARIISVQALGKYDDSYAQLNDLFLGGQIGNSTYEDLDTGGIGINVDSYLRFSGIGDFFNPPTNYTFDRLTGIAWGINTTVQCTPSSVFNVTLISTYSGSRGDTFRVFNVSGPGYNIMFSSPEDNMQPYAFTVLASNNAIPPAELKPDQWVNLVVLAPTFLDQATFVCMCSISARQYAASVSVTGIGGTVQYSPLGQSKDVSGPYLSQDQTAFLEELINIRVGSAIAAAMDQIIDNSTIPLGDVISSILSAATRIRMTVKKQRYERASASIPGKYLDGTYFDLEYTVQQIGSGRKGLFWLFLPILMFLTGIGGLLFAYTRGETAIVDLTDPVAVSAIMVGSSIPELDGRSSGNSTVLDRELLDGVGLVLRVKGDRRIEFTTNETLPRVEAKETYS